MGGSGVQALDHRAVYRERPRRSLRRLPKLARGSFALVLTAARGHFLAAAALQLLGGLGLAAQLLLAREVLQRVLPEDGRQPSFGPVALPLLAFVCVTALVGFTTQIRSSQQRLLAALVAQHALRQVHQVTVRVPLLAFDHAEFHNRLQRALINSQTRPLQLVTGIIGLLSGLFGVLGITVALLLLQPLLVALIFLAYVPTWLISIRVNRSTYNFSHEQTERDRERLYLAELLTEKSHAQELRSYGLGPYLIDRYERLVAERMRDLRSLVARQLRLGLTGSAVTSVLGGAALAVLVLLVTSGRTDPAGAATAGAALLLLGQRLQGLLSGVSSLYEGSLFLEDYFAFLEQAPSTSNPAARRDEAPPPLSIELRDVSFSYPSSSALALDGVDLQLRAGELVALVGENGSGKTTLAKLVAGLYEPDSGSVLWNGQDRAALDVDAVRARSAVMFQDFARYHLTAIENVQLGNVLVHAPEQVQDALQKSGADEFLARLPRAEQSRLGPQFEGGHELSGGEWQRLALARSFYRDAPLLVLDEPTAALDPRAEHDLLGRVRELAAGRSVLLVSHRFSNVRGADRIYVLEGGRVTEQGSHEELLAAGGKYAELFRLQASAYTDELLL